MGYETIKDVVILFGLALGTVIRSGATVLVIKRGEEVAPNPDPVWELKPGDIVLLLGTPEQLNSAGRLFMNQKP